MDDSVVSFYEQLAEDYHLIYADWRRSIERQSGILDQLIRAELGAAPLTLLDCTCGIGTQALGLAALGYRVHATDLSPASVARARREAAALGLALSFDVADVRALRQQVSDSFDVVISCDNGLPHLLTQADVLLALQNMAACLSPGGLLLLSIRDYDRLTLERPRATPVAVLDGPAGRRITFQVWDWDADGRCYTLQHFLLQQDGALWRTAQRTTRYRALPRAELDELLSQAGFVAPRWHMPEQTDFHQPILTARLSTGH